MTALKIPDEFGVLTENARRRELYKKYIRPEVQHYLTSPSGQAHIAREVSTRVRAEVEAIIAKRTQEQVAELARMESIRGPAVGEILLLVSNVTGCSVPELLGPRRARNCAWPRFLAVHLFLQCRPDLSTPAIGRVLGGRDHTTVIAARNKFATLHEVEPVSRWLVDERVIAMLAKRPQLAPMPMAEAA